MVKKKYGQKLNILMNQNNQNEPNKILLLEAPKQTAVNPPNTADTAVSDEASDTRKYGENTGRDPSTGRFLTGNSGKPVGAQHFSTMFKKVIRQAGGVSKEGEKVSYDEIMVKKIVNLAAGGNLKAATIVMDRVDGKVRQPVDVTSGGERIEGTVVLSAEEDDRIKKLFRRKKPPEPKIDEKVKENGNNKQNTDTSNGQGDRRGTGVPEAKQERSAYERS
jgi:hypothetical protein